MAEVPCGCDGAAILVDPCFYEHDALLAGFDGQELRPARAPDRPANAGGANAIDHTACGPYVPVNLQTLNAGDGLAVTGTGGTTAWEASIVLVDDADNAASLVSGKLMVAKADAAVSGISSTASCDEQLSNVSGGLTAGGKHYSAVKTALDTQPNQNWTAGQGGYVTTQPHIGNIVSVDVTNPSCARAMAVQWTIVAELPYVATTAGTFIVFSLYEASYLLSAQSGGWSDVAQGAQTSLVGKMSPLAYTASGVIPPNDTLRVNGRLRAWWSAGSVDFTLPTSQPLTLTSNDVRIDVIGSTV